MTQAAELIGGGLPEAVDAGAGRPCPPHTFYRFSAAAAAEANAYVRSLAQDRWLPVDAVTVTAAAAPRFAAELRSTLDRLDSYPRWLVYAPTSDGFDLRERATFAWLLGNLLGEPLTQDASGRRIAYVYDRDSRMIEAGARYHQTNQGGHIHNDQTRPYSAEAADDPDMFHYFVFSCATPALVGGETVLVSTADVYRELTRFPDALAELRQPFWYENRASSGSSGLFQMPVIGDGAGGEPEFRYMKSYIEAAHHKAGVPLTARQAWALDVLAAIVERSDLQFRFRLRRGETLVTYDAQVMHGRASFADQEPHRPVDVDRDRADGHNRCLMRIWSRRSGGR